MTQIPSARFGQTYTLHGHFKPFDEKISDGPGQRVKDDLRSD